MSNISTDQVWGQNYDGIEIKSDERVHSEIAKVLQRLFPDRTSAISVLLHRGMELSLNEFKIYIQIGVSKSMILNTPNPSAKSRLQQST